MNKTSSSRNILSIRGSFFISSFRIHLQDTEYQKEWLELTLNEFLEDGNVETFIRCLTDVVKAHVKTSGRGEISRLAKELKIDRSNLSEIVNGDKQPRLETAFKLLNGLGFKYDIRLQSA